MQLAQNRVQRQDLLLEVLKLRALIPRVLEGITNLYDEGRCALIKWRNSTMDCHYTAQRLSVFIGKLDYKFCAK